MDTSTWRQPYYCRSNVYVLYITILNIKLSLGQTRLIVAMAVEVTDKFTASNNIHMSEFVQDT